MQNESPQQSFFFFWNSISIQVRESLIIILGNGLEWLEREKKNLVFFLLPCIGGGWQRGVGDAVGRRGE